MRYVFLGIVSFLMIAIGCDDGSNVTQPDRSHQKIPFLYENSEAEEMALWITGEFLAPLDIYEAFDYGLAAVRNEYGDSINELNTIYFTGWWTPGYIICEITYEAVQEIRAGTYTDLDSLNGLYGLTEVDTLLFTVGMWWITLTFGEMYNPEYLVDSYITVPSILFAEPNRTFNNYFNVYPWLIGGGTSYLFRNGWGDCMSGCVYNKFWYFWVIGNTVELVGTWDTSLQQDPPQWWTYGQTAYVYHRTGELPVVSGIK